MRTYRLWYVLELTYEDDEPEDLLDAVSYGEHLDRQQLGEEVELEKVERM